MGRCPQRQMVYLRVSQGMVWDDGKETKHLDLACSMCLMVVLIFVSIDSCVCDLEMGLGDFSNWSLLLQGAVLCSRRFAFPFLRVWDLPVLFRCVTGVNAGCYTQPERIVVAISIYLSIYILSIFSIAIKRSFRKVFVLRKLSLQWQQFEMVLRRN